MRRPRATKKACWSGCGAFRFATGNRLFQHDVQNAGLPHVDLSFDQTRNQITAINNNPQQAGLSYDAAGNMAGFGRHSYAHDVDGSLRGVDNYQKASNLYDAFGRRVYSQPNPNTFFRYEYNQDGQISDIWCGDNKFECQSRFYANGQMFAYFQGNADYSQYAMHFQHSDYLDTVHSRTIASGPTTSDPGSAREGIYYALPFGDGIAFTAGNGASGGTDDSNAHYAGLEHDTYDIYSDAEVALHRTYIAAQGSWLEPDPYDGSYDGADPQSFNRYAYANNNPLSFSDPADMQYGDGEGRGDGGDNGLGSFLGDLLNSIEHLFGGSNFHGSTSPRPPVWTDHGGFYFPNTSLLRVDGILSAAGVGTGGCDFGPCGFQSPAYPNGHDPNDITPSVGDVGDMIRYGVLSSAHDVGELLHFTRSYDGLPGCSMVGLKALGRAIKSVVSPVMSRPSSSDMAKQLLTMSGDLRPVAPLALSAASRDLGASGYFASFVFALSPEISKLMHTPCQ